MAITPWLHYADHPLAPICRSRHGANMVVGDNCGGRRLRRLAVRVQESPNGDQSEGGLRHPSAHREFPEARLGLRRLPREVTAFEIEVFFQFSAAESRIIEERGRPELKLGLALQIGFLRMSGRLLDAAHGMGTWEG